MPYTQLTEEEFDLHGLTKPLQANSHMYSGSIPQNYTQRRVTIIINTKLISHLLNYKTSFITVDCKLTGAETVLSVSLVEH